MLDFDDRVRRVLAEQHDEIAALKAENVKLRELVRDMWMCIDNRHGCEECYEECYGMGAMETNGETGEIHCNQHFAAMMRKLGIEVDA